MLLFVSDFISVFHTSLSCQQINFPVQCAPYNFPRDDRNYLDNHFLLLVCLFIFHFLHEDQKRICGTGCALDLKNAGMDP